MRRKVSAFFVVMLAMLLSVALAVPASADASSDFWNNLANQQKPGGNQQYKYGFDYRQQEWKATPGGQQAVNNLKAPLPVSPTVNPSTTGPSWYLNQWRNRTTAPTNAPLQGKIITPGKTVVRIPSTYGVSGAVNGSTLSKSLGLLRFGAFIGAGMGGTSVAPANSNQLALGQGVRQACLDGTSPCTSDEIAKKFKIDSCGNLTGASSCNSIGALGPEGDALSKDWFADTALPFLADLWGKITGQEGGALPTQDFYEVVMPRGCYREFGVEYRGENNLTLHQRSEIVSPKPAGTGAQSQYWDYECGAAAVSTFSPSHSLVKTVCQDADGVTGTSTQSYGMTGQVGYFVNELGANKIGMCNTGIALGKPLTLMRVRIGNADNQTYYANEGPSKYSALRYTEWVNPDPKLNTIEALEVTTTWDCKTPDGVTYTFTKTAAKVAAAISPDCPPGSDLVRHDITAKEKNGGSTTLDAGGPIPSEVAKYPNCFGASPGCAIDVYVDGTKCVVGREDCLNWPALAARTPSRVSCHWGSYTVPMADCRQISNGYKTETGVVFDPNSGTWVGVDTYGNPVDANPEPWNPTNPTPTPGVNPSTPTTTTPGTTTPGSTFPQTGTNPATGDNCSAPFWSWNPVEFVKNPVVCALKDAFVPKTDIQARVQQISSDAADTVPISWISTPIVGPSGGGCPNWNINVAGLSKNVVCESSFTAAIVGARGPMFGIVASAMIWPLLRSIWYALIPIVRVSPSGSK